MIITFWNRGSINIPNVDLRVDKNNYDIANVLLNNNNK